MAKRAIDVYPVDWVVSLNSPGKLRMIYTIDAENHNSDMRTILEEVADWRGITLNIILLLDNSSTG